MLTLDIFAMMTPDIAIYEITAFLLIIPLSYFLSRIVKLIRRKGYEDDIKMLFNLYWNGRNEDELYAWYRVRHILMQRGVKKQKLRFVERKIDEINKQSLYGKMSITESGKLLDEAPNTKIL